MVNIENSGHFSARLMASSCDGCSSALIFLFLTLAVSRSVLVRLAPSLLRSKKPDELCLCQKCFVHEDKKESRKKHDIYRYRPSRFDDTLSPVLRHCVPIFLILDFLISQFLCLILEEEPRSVSRQTCSYLLNSQPNPFPATTKTGTKTLKDSLWSDGSRKIFIIFSYI